MELASLIVSIVGCVLSGIGIVITLMLTRKTKYIENQLKDKIKYRLTAGHFSEKKSDYIQTLNKVRDSLLKNMNNELDDENWAALDRVLKQLSLDVDVMVKTMSEDSFEDLKDIIVKTFENIMDSNGVTMNRNKMSISFIDTILATLESSSIIGG